MYVCDFVQIQWKSVEFLVLETSSSFYFSLHLSSLETHISEELSELTDGGKTSLNVSLGPWL